MSKNKNVKKPKSTASKIAKIIMHTLGYIICLFLVAIMVQNLLTKTNKNYIPKLFGHTYLTVLSNSMDSEFSQYDLIIGKSVNQTPNLKIGDIITFRNANMLVTHRINRISPEGLFVTKGDANNTEDENLVSSKDIVSVYQSKVPKLGYILLKLQSPIVLGIVWLLLMALIISEIIKEVLSIRRKKHALIPSANTAS